MPGRGAFAYIVALVLVAVLSNFHPAFAGDKQDFWNIQRAGANCFNVDVDDEWMRAARERHIQFVRLSFSRWKSSAGSRDFLLGNADNYRSLPEVDLKKLIAGLDLAQKWGIKIIVTPLSLPGGRWAQQTSNGKPDLRIWRDGVYQEQAASFWRDLAKALREHPAVVGYNIINEPMPERATEPPLNDSLVEGFGEWYQTRARGTPADLNAFYRKVVAAIRQVDQETPVVLDAGQYATVNAFDYLEPIVDPCIIYSFHQYEPGAYTNFRENKGQILYPGAVKSEDDTRTWNARAIERYVGRVSEWAKRHNVDHSRILAGEFGVHRKLPGAAEYLADNIAAFNKFGWHWAFYSFREDGWDGMDYELGTRIVDYWDSDAGPRPEPLKRGDNPIFAPIKSGLDAIWRR